VHQRPCSTAASGSRRACVRSSERVDGRIHVCTGRVYNISGNSNHMTETQGVQLMRQEAGPRRRDRQFPLPGRRQGRWTADLQGLAFRQGPYILHTSPRQRPRVAASGTVDGNCFLVTTATVAGGRTTTRG
jgi:hypothetical protein